MGAKKRPFYRVVVTDSRKPRGGRYIESLGYYDPMKEPPDVKIEEERLFGWLSNGAQPTASVQSLISKLGLSRKFEMLKRGEDVSQLEIPPPRFRVKKKPQKPSAAEEKPKEVETAEIEKKADTAEPEATEEEQAVEKEEVVEAKEVAEEAASQEKPKKAPAKKKVKKTVAAASEAKAHGKTTKPKAAAAKSSPVKKAEKKSTKDDT
jgi:small subunit ribosomal protein S16